MRIDERFNLRYGHSLELNRLTKVKAPDGVNFVGRSAVNNGVTARVAPPKGIVPGTGGELTVALGGSVLSTFVQPEPFVCGRDGAILTPRDSAMPTAERLWWARCIWENHYRYGYGRQANRTLAALELPDRPPEWVSAAPEPSVASLKLVSQAADLVLAPPRSVSKLIRLDTLFDLRYGHSLELNRLTKVKAPDGVNFVGRSAVNNGVTARVAPPKGIVPGTGGELTVALGGSVLSTFVQPEPFVCGRDGAILTPKDCTMSFGERFWWHSALLQTDTGSATAVRPTGR